MGVARRLALGRLISLSGGSAAYIALVAAIYARTHSAVWISAAIFASVVASVASAPLAGWIGDRFDRRRVLIGADLAAAAVSLAMALTGEPWALVVLLGLSSVAQSPFEPASTAALPNLVEPKDVPRANALVAATSSAAYLAGPLLGGLILGAGASPSTLFAVDAATFVVSALLVATIRRPFGRGATDEHPGMLAGFGVIVREPRLRVPVFAGMVSLVGVGIVEVASYPLSLDLHGGARGYGAMTALLGGGGLLGTVLAGRVLRAGSSRILVWSFTIGAAGLALAGVAPVLAIGLGGMALAGAGRGLGDVAATTLIQEQTHNAVRSRVFAAQDGAAHAAFSVAALSGGLLVQLASARGAFAVAAAFGIAAAVIAATRPDGLRTSTPDRT
ncbi:MAG TPA: MFS transporter [Gaiellaceae bacterium]|jgi:MFS family permease|nr:MFS transporter [Gaiellaceae bacterium]